LFAFRAGDSIRERLGDEITSLMADFVVLGALESDSLLVSEPQEAH